MATTPTPLDVQALSDDELCQLDREVHDEGLRRGLWAFVAPDTPCMELHGAGLLRGDA